MNYTSIEQSKQLLELGLNPESADMAFMFFNDNGHIVNKVPFVMTGEEAKEDGMFNYIPCWSVGRLLELIRMSYKIHKNQGNNTITVILENDIMVFCETNYVDVCFNTVKWLLENGYIKKGK